MTTRRDYHIQVDVKNVGGEDIHRRMIESWAMALEALGMPFVLPAIRMQTVQPPEQAVFHRMIYGICHGEQPSARKIRAAVLESLAIHDFSTARVEVAVYVVTREIVSLDAEPGSSPHVYGTTLAA